LAQDPLDSSCVMSRLGGCETQRQQRAAEVETLIFLDVDGVLNVCARDQTGSKQLLLNSSSLQTCRKQWAHRHRNPNNPVIETIMALDRRRLNHGEDDTYSKFACTAPSQLSEVLVSRLAKIIEAAEAESRPGEDSECNDPFVERHMKKVAVVLSSTWRKPEHAGRVKRLEEMITKYLNYPFRFEARTRLADEVVASERLTAISDFVHDFCVDRLRLGCRNPLKVLVLEDFFIMPIDFVCNGVSVGNATKAGIFIEKRAAQARSGRVKAKVVHTYDQFETPEGLVVEVGEGLTQKRLCQALSFFGQHCSHCGRHGNSQWSHGKDVPCPEPAPPQSVQPCPLQQSQVLALKQPDMPALLQQFWRLCFHFLSFLPWSVTSRLPEKIMHLKLL